MKKTLKTRIGAITLATTLTLGSNVVLSQNNFVEAKGLDQVSVIYNGEKLEFDQEPIIEDGRTKVPFRKIFESMGTIVYYNNTDNMILGLTKTGDILTHKIGSNKASLNGVEKTYDTTSTVQNGRTLVPVRMISELMGATVNWDDKTKTVDINKKEESIDSTRKDIMDHIFDINFNPKDVNRYVDYKKKNPNLSTEQVIIDVNIDMDKELVLTKGPGIGEYANLMHYEAKKEDVEVIDYTDNPYIYINKFKALPEDYIVNNLSEYKLNGHKYLFRPEVINDLSTMLQEASNNVGDIDIHIGYGDYNSIEFDFSEFLSAGWLEESLGENYVYERYPQSDFSELRTGLSIVFYPPASDYYERNLYKEKYVLNQTDYSDDATKIYEPQKKWLRENAYKYGFIERYPENKSNITRYASSTNFYRYVGKEIAQKMHDENLCFDEYYAKYLNPTVNDYEYSIDYEGTQKVLKNY